MHQKNQKHLNHNITSLAMNTIIALPTTDTKYDWVVANDSYGVIKQYCPEDLVQ